MSNVVTIAPNMQLTPAMQEYLKAQGGLKTELAAGVTAGFAVVGYRGKVWHIKHRGEETPQLREDDGTPKARMEFVIVKASAAISKIFYIDGWQEGNSAPPDCWSVDGVRPDAAAPKKQCSNCAGCPMNQWGSAVTPAGKKTKRCTDSKRLAVVPLGDIENHRYGGAMLLRVPAASLSDMASYDNALLSKGFPYFGVGTAISFDIAESYPKFVFTGIRALTDEEAMKVIALRDDDQVNRILSAPVEEVTADVASPAGQTISQQATARDPAVIEAERAAAVKAAQDAVLKANAEKEAEAAAKQAATQEAAKKAEAEKAAAVAAAAAAGPTPAELEARIRAEVEAKIKAEMAARAATATPQSDPVAGITVGAATPVAANTDKPPVTVAAASDVVDAEIISEQTDAKSPEGFDNLLDDLLKS